jgi:hypothetical protein
MKSLLGKLGVVLIGLLIFVIGCQKTVLKNESTKGVDWKFYNSNEMYLTYYYTKNITHPSKNVVRVWERWNLTEKGVLVWVQELGKEYENLSHFIILWEINCTEKKSRSLSETSYDNKGKVIISSSSPKEWDFIIPESMHENLYKEVCK